MPTFIVTYANLDFVHEEIEADRMTYAAGVPFITMHRDNEVVAYIPASNVLSIRRK